MLAAAVDKKGHPEAIVELHLSEESFHKLKFKSQIQQLDYLFHEKGHEALTCVDNNHHS